MFFLFPELNSIKNVTMLKKLPDHFKSKSALKSRPKFWSLFYIVVQSKLFSCFWHEDNEDDRRLFAIIIKMIIKSLVFSQIKTQKKVFSMK